MKDLKEIGFYTLSNERAKQTSVSSPLWRCELLITNKCNFNCPYCRNLRSDIDKELTDRGVYPILDYWISEGLKNIRFSGGEPTLHPSLIDYVKYCKDNGVERIAISTNGSASLGEYDQLVKAGVNDFSISLDGGCCSTGELMTGGVKGSWNKAVTAIKELSKLTYTTVGMVFTEDNITGCLDAVIFVDGLGCHDIRVIPSAQYNKALARLDELPISLLNRHPILRYRVQNIKMGYGVRGINGHRHKCWLVLDDMAVAGGYHFPCIIYLREGGEPIGRICDEWVRADRYNWAKAHQPHLDKICKEMCLDVCVDYNAEVESDIEF